MEESRVAVAGRDVRAAIGGLRAASGSHAGDDELIVSLVACERSTRELEALSLATIAQLDRRGVFTDRGYTRAAAAAADLLSWDMATANRRVRVAGQVTHRVGVDGQVMAPELPATASAFADGAISLRHIEVISDALRTSAAKRVDPQTRAGVEEKLAEFAAQYRPHELGNLARNMIAALDQDGPGPDEDEPPQPNELFLSRFGPEGGGRIRGRLDALTYAAVATALAALSKPGADDPRTQAERHADALGEICQHALDTADLPECGGERPHVTVTMSLRELESRWAGGALDIGGRLGPADLRTMLCDSRVLPVVLGGNGEPLDVGRARRTVTPAQRRVVAVRDDGCAHPGCDRPPSWCQAHHIAEWAAHHGDTAIDNPVMLYAVHHRLIHHPGWTVRMYCGRPEFIPPQWIDPHQTPRRKPPPAVTTILRT